MLGSFIQQGTACVKDSNNSSTQAAPSSHLQSMCWSCSEGPGDPTSLYVLWKTHLLPCPSWQFWLLSPFSPPSFCPFMVKLKFKDFSKIMSVYVCGRVHTYILTLTRLCTCEYKCPLNPEENAGYSRPGLRNSCKSRILGTEPESSLRGASIVLNHGAISLAFKSEL